MKLKLHCHVNNRRLTTFKRLKVGDQFIDPIFMIAYIKVKCCYVDGSKEVNERVNCVSLGSGKLIDMSPDRKMSRLKPKQS
jgi:hypothetical protein